MSGHEGRKQPASASRQFKELGSSDDLIRKRRGKASGSQSVAENKRSKRTLSNQVPSGGPAVASSGPASEEEVDFQPSSSPPMNQMAPEGVEQNQVLPARQSRTKATSDSDSDCDQEEALEESADPADTNPSASTSAGTEQPAPSSDTTTRPPAPSSSSAGRPPAAPASKPAASANAKPRRARGNAASAKQGTFLTFL
jgi:hypothetical protein